MRRRSSPTSTRLFPDRFSNKTNGVTPRRWLAQANPPLAGADRRRIGARLAARPGRSWPELRPLADDAGVRAARSAMPSAQTSSGWRTTIASDLRHRRSTRDALFDVQVKRMHEYKRQLLNVLHVVTRYHRILARAATPTGCRAR